MNFACSTSGPVRKRNRLTYEVPLLLVECIYIKSCKKIKQSFKKNIHCVIIGLICILNSEWCSSHKHFLSNLHLTAEVNFKHWEEGHSDMLVYG